MVKRGKLMKKAALHNLGCKVNAYETEAMQQILEKNGYEIVPFAPGADLYLINTCTVTNIADRKSRQMIHKARKMNPKAVVVAAGCYVQASSEELTADGSVDVVIGNNRKKDLIKILKEFEEGRATENVIDMMCEKQYENLSIQKTAEHTRAYIKVQDGCNQFCSYCIIPYTRGRVRSRSEEEVIEEVTELAHHGYQEVVLTGIHLSSYGTDTGSSLIQLIEQVHQIEGIKRIRLGSLEPGIVTQEFAQRLKNLEKFCPHFHLSLQSGCDATLKRMNRRYTTQEYREKCAILRTVFENPALTTDVIVGFPGETQEEFEQTKLFLEEIKFFETHIFKYSRRKGTRAAGMENQVPDSIKNVRSNELIQLNEKNQTLFEEAWKDKKVQVLCEEEIEIDGIKYYSGHTKEYIRTAVEAQYGKENRILSGTLKKELKPHVRLCTID